MHPRKAIVIITCVVLICLTVIMCAFILQGDPPSNFRYETVSQPWLLGSKQQVYRIDLRTGKATLVIDPDQNQAAPAKPEAKSEYDLFPIK